MRVALGEAAFEAATAEGGALSFWEFLDEALVGLEEVATGFAVVPSGPVEHIPRESGLLTPRALEVLALVANGPSNKAIAAPHYVSPNTVKTHVASLLHKLDAESCRQLPAIAAGAAQRLTAPVLQRLASHLPDVPVRRRCMLPPCPASPDG